MRLHVFVCRRKTEIACACVLAVRQTGREAPKAFFLFNTGDFFLNCVIDIHSSVCGNSHVPRAGKSPVWFQRAAPVYSGYTPTSVHLPVSQSSDAMKEGVSSLLGLCR